jgi:uncharacterized protein (DUF1778 family)
MTTVQVLVRKVPALTHQAIKAAAALRGETLRAFVLRASEEEAQRVLDKPRQKEANAR